MISANGTYLNGHGVNGHVLHCSSDYEPASLDVTPKVPRPGWRDAFPTFTHNISWLDADGCHHSMTLRSDSLQDLLGDLKLVKANIRQAKQKASVVSSETPQTQPERILC